MWLNVTSGAVRVARFSQTKPAQLLLKTSPIAFRGGFPGKVPGSKYSIPAFQGLNITLLGSLQPADMKNNPRQQSAQMQATSLPQAPLAALFRRRQQTKLSLTQRKGPMAGFIWLQFTINTSNRHTFYLHFLVCYCSSSIQAPCFSLLNLNVYIFFWHCHLWC